MWVLWTLVGFVVLGYLGYLWLGVLVTKYEHTIESVLVLFFLLGSAVYTGLTLSYVSAPVLGIWPRIVITSVLGSLIFVGFSFVAVHLWCSFLTKDFDDRIGFLEEKKDEVETKLNILRFSHLSQRLAPQTHEKTTRHNPECIQGTEDGQALQDFLDKWQQAGGAARVRSIKVSEWQEEVRLFGTHELKREITELTAENQEGDDEVKKEHAKGKLAVMKLELTKRTQTCSTDTVEVVQDDKETERLGETESQALRRQLQNTVRELQLTEAHKREFLRGKIRLSWRVRP